MEQLNTTDLYTHLLREVNIDIIKRAITDPIKFEKTLRSNLLLSDITQNDVSSMLCVMCDLHHDLASNAAFDAAMEIA